MKHEVLQNESGKQLQERLKLISQDENIKINQICNSGDCILCNIRLQCEKEVD